MTVDEETVAVRPRTAFDQQLTNVVDSPVVVAAVLSEAWGVPISVHAIWPELRDGAAPVPPHLTPWVAARTLEDLGPFIGSDMLSRRDTLTNAVSVAAGAAFLGPIVRWIGLRATGLDARPETPERIGTEDVARIERSVWYFAAADAEIGGGLSREAAVGQLKYAVDLARHASFSDAVGNRLLAAIAGLVGWMGHDSGMPGPAQRYLLYGLQAARESTDPRAPLLAVRILTDMGQQMRRIGEHATAVRLLDLAAAQLPADRSRFNVVRVLVSGQRAWTLSYLGRSAMPEVRNALALSEDLYDHATDGDRAATRDLVHRSLDLSRAELAATAASAYLVLAHEDRRLAGDAADRTLYALENATTGQGRNRTLSQIRLARTRFIAGEPEQGCVDGERALALAEGTASWMVVTRQRELLADSEPYREQPRVRELRERLRTRSATGPRSSRTPSP